MYISEDIRKELDFFKRTNEHFEIEAGKATCKVKDASDEMLYMAMSASLAMNYSEDGFFENFVITDKSISGKNELQIDAYALIETESSKVKQLHVFQYKLHKDEKNSASPIDLLNFTTSVNNNFVHPTLMEKPSENEVIIEIKKKVDEFLTRRDRRIVVYCHFINNAKGITKSNQKDIEEVFERFISDKQTRQFSVQVYGEKDILELARDGKIQVGSETLELLNDRSMYSYRLEDNSNRPNVGLPNKVVIGMCNVNEFIRLQNKYHNNQLYAENIRLYLGDRGNVNKDIIRTITGVESLWFPYMNNGISIICDKLTIGNENEKKHIQNFTIENMQIINGCQTVNALYSAKYGESTKDNFHPANVMVRIYEIDPKSIDFKTNIIKATNNQNSVKSYSLVANDPIQISIAATLQEFNILYDRKGEGRDAKSNQLVINMVNVALAYRAVYLFMARSLRSGLGQSRVFQKGEYEKVFDSNLLEDGNEERFNVLCFKLIIASSILNTVRDLIQGNAEIYIDKLPIVKKSTYYMAGYMYALKKKEFDAVLEDMNKAYVIGIEEQLKGKNYPARIEGIVSSSFDATIQKFILFYNKQKGIDKTDIDNLLKSKDFGDAYLKEIEEMTGKTVIEEDE
jgi:hypothetical protein